MNPNISRRGLLQGLGVAAAAGAVGALTPATPARATTYTDGGLRADVHGRTVTVTLTTRALRPEDMGLPIRLHVGTQLEDAPLDADHLRLEAVAPNGDRWAKERDWYASGGWQGGCELVLPVSRDLWYNAAVLTATLTFADGAASDHIDARVAIGSDVVEYALDVAPEAPRSGAPAAALAAGFSTLSFHDDFDDIASIDIEQRGTSGYRWYPHAPGGYPAVTRADYSVSDSLLHLHPQTSNCNQQLVTNLPSGAGRSFRFGYFEARLRASSRVVSDYEFQHPPFAWPAWWARSQAATRGIITDVAELDFFEGFVGVDTIASTVHIDRGSGRHYRTPIGYATKNVGVDLSADFHTYGCLWESGHVAHYFDDVLVGELRYSPTHDEPRCVELDRPTVQGPDGTFHVLDLETAPDRDGLTLVLGTGVEHAMDVDWVRVWGH